MQELLLRLLVHVGPPLHLLQPGLHRGWQLGVAGQCLGKLQGARRYGLPVLQPCGRGVQQQRHQGGAELEALVVRKAPLVSEGDHQRAGLLLDLGILLRLHAGQQHRQPDVGLQKSRLELWRPSRQSSHSSEALEPLVGASRGILRASQEALQGTTIDGRLLDVGVVCEQQCENFQDAHANHARVFPKEV